MHENPGRIRIQALPEKMSLEQADLLEGYIQTLEGVRRVAVHERTGCAVICYVGAREALLTALSRFSYTGKAAQALAPSLSHSRRRLGRKYQEKLVCRVAAKALSSLYLPQPVGVAYTLVKALPYLWRAGRCLLRGQLHVELLDGLSIGISLVQGNFSTARSVMFLLGLGELLEEWTHKKSVDDLARSMSLNVDRVWMKTPEGEALVPLTQVRPGDLIALRVGGLVPLDGVVQEGEIMVNQSSLTGESVPVPKRPGAALYAGTVVEEGECVLKVQRQPGASRYDKIVAMIEQSEKLKSAAEGRAARLADKLVPYTLAGSALTWLLTGDLTRASSVLMVDFSCALKLSMPLAVLSAMREAGNYRATVKGGKFLEAIAKADTVVFDKTGTLTHASPVVAQVIPFGGHSEDEMLRLAACLEEHFPHSMANAVVKAARDRGLLHDEMHTQTEYIVAHGISSLVGGERAVIGSAHFVFEDEHIAIPAGEEDRFAALPASFSHLYLALGGELAAVICISDPLRSEAAGVIGALRRLGVTNMVMLTGDSERTAAAIAREVGVDRYRSEVLPEDKARFVEEARRQGRTVIMIGDGINDSPALSAAGVGVAISDGAAIAREIADVTVSSDDLRGLVSLRCVAMALMDRIHSNYRFVIGFNGSLIALGALGILTPGLGAMLHNLSTLAISLRSMTNLLGG